MTSGIRLSLKGAEFQYPNSSQLVLRGLDLDIRPGEWVAVLGSNGSGKSTLLKLFNALLIPTQGICLAGGVETGDPEAAWQIRAQVSLVFQNPEDQIVASVVEEDTAFGPENLGFPSEEIRRRVEIALKTVGLLEKRDRPVSTLSGGQKQRLALAGALAASPRCLLLDEATSMLDPMARREFCDVIKKEHQAGMTIAQVTHRLEEITAADRVIVLEKGSLLWQGTAVEFFNQSERFFASMGFARPPLAVLRDELAERGILSREVLPDIDRIKEALCR